MQYHRFQGTVPAEVGEKKHLNKGFVLHVYTYTQIHIYLLLKGGIILMKRLNKECVMNDLFVRLSVELSYLEPKKEYRLRQFAAS